MLFVAFCCSFWFLVRVSICRSLLSAALRCSFWFFVGTNDQNEQQKTKKVHMETRLHSYMLMK